MFISRLEGAGEGKKHLRMPRTVCNGMDSCILCNCQIFKFLPSSSSSSSSWCNQCELLFRDIAVYSSLVKRLSKHVLDGLFVKERLNPQICISDRFRAYIPISLGLQIHTYIHPGKLGSIGGRSFVCHSLVTLTNSSQ